MTDFELSYNEINNNLPDNLVQYITAARLRSVLYTMLSEIDENDVDLLQQIDDINTQINNLTNTISNKQDVLTFDSTPTNGSTNPVTSQGIYNAIEAVNSNVLAYLKDSENLTHYGSIMSANPNRMTPWNNIFQERNEITNNVILGAGGSFVSGGANLVYNPSDYYMTFTITRTGTTTFEGFFTNQDEPTISNVADDYDNHANYNMAVNHVADYTPVYIYRNNNWLYVGYIFAFRYDPDTHLYTNIQINVTGAEYTLPLNVETTCRIPNLGINGGMGLYVGSNQLVNGESDNFSAILGKNNSVSTSGNLGNDYILGYANGMKGLGNSIMLGSFNLSQFDVQYRYSNNNIILGAFNKTYGAGGDYIFGLNNTINVGADTYGSLYNRMQYNAYLNMILGWNNTSSKDDSISIGHDLTNTGNDILIGKYNEASDADIVVAVGDGAGSEHNAVEIWSQDNANNNTQDRFINVNGRLQLTNDDDEVIEDVFEAIKANEESAGWIHNATDNSVRQKTSNYSYASGNQALVTGRSGRAIGTSATSIGGAALAHYIWYEQDFDQLTGGPYYISPVNPTTAEANIAADAMLFGKGADVYVGLPIIDRYTFEEKAIIDDASYDVEKPWILKVWVTGASGHIATDTPTQSIIWPYGMAKGSCAFAKMGIANDLYATALGRRSLVDGNSAADLGAANEIHAQNGIAIGYGNTNNGSTSQIIGTSNVNTGTNALVAGFNAINNASQGLVLGAGNKFAIMITGAANSTTYEFAAMDNNSNPLYFSDMDTWLPNEPNFQWYKVFVEEFLVGSMGVGFYDHNITPLVTSVDIANDTITFASTLNPNEAITNKWIIFGSSNAKAASPHGIAIEGYVDGYEGLAINKGFALDAYSTAIGEGTIARNPKETALGHYNVSNSDTDFSIGNGTWDTPNNALEIKTDGKILGQNGLPVGYEYLFRKTYEPRTDSGAKYLYFGAVKRTSYDKPAIVRYTVNWHGPNEGVSEIIAHMIDNSALKFIGYNTWNNTQGVTYSAAGRYVNQTGFNNGASDLLGFYLNAALSTSGVIPEVVIYSVENCTFTPFDSLLLDNETPDYVASNYMTGTSYITSANGFQCGINTNTTNTLNYSSSFTLTLGNTVGANALGALASDNQYYNIWQSYSTATNKILTANLHFLPENLYVTSTNDTAGNHIWNRYQSVNSVYIHNHGNAYYTADLPLYIQLNLESDGYFSATGEFVQTLPTTNDGYYYHKIGIMQSSYLLYFDNFNSATYYHDGTSLKKW